MRRAQHRFIMRRHYSIRIHGAVQGVFFRHSAKMKADALGLAGYARNEKDGSVEIEIEGEEESLERFLEWCKRGPSAARVTRLSCVPADALQGYEAFKIF